METTLKLRITEIFTRNRFSKEDSQLITETMNEIDDRQHEKFQQAKELFLTQKDKIELIDRINASSSTLKSTIYLVGLVQFLSIIGAVLAILHFAKAGL